MAKDLAVFTVNLSTYSVHIVSTYDRVPITALVSKYTNNFGDIMNNYKIKQDGVLNNSVFLYRVTFDLM